MLLDYDNFYEIFRYLDLADVLRMRLVCKEFARRIHPDDIHSIVKLLHELHIWKNIQWREGVMLLPKSIRVSSEWKMNEFDAAKYLLEREFIWSPRNQWIYMHDRTVSLSLDSHWLLKPEVMERRYGTFPVPVELILVNENKIEVYQYEQLSIIQILTLLEITPLCRGFYISYFHYSVFKMTLEIQVLSATESCKISSPSSVN